MPDTTIGFIGLGIVAAPMAANLAHAGYPLVVHNRSPSKVEDFAGGLDHSALLTVIEQQSAHRISESSRPPG